MASCYEHFSFFKPDTENNAILTLYQANAPTLMPFSKKRQNFEVCINVKVVAVYNRVSEEWLDEEQHSQSAGEGHGVPNCFFLAAADAVRILIKTSTQLGRCC